jgi:putative ABC transport system substrate-binding protein
MRCFALLLGALSILATGAAALAAQTQPAAGMPSIGYLADGPSPDALVPFRQALRERGWVEGENVGIAYRYARGKAERFPEVAAELVREGVGVIVADGVPAVTAARGASGSVPIVMTLVGDPVAAGLVRSLTRPGDNVTGVATFSPQASARRLALIRQILPTLATLAILWNPKNRALLPEVGATQAAAHAGGLRVVLVEVPGPRDVGNVFAAMKEAGAGALLVLEPVGPVSQKRIAATAVKRQVPTFWTQGELLDLGGVLAYGAATGDVFRRAAALVDRILRGAKAGNLAVERAPRFELTVNLGTARELGLAIPREVYGRADRVIR